MWKTIEELDRIPNPPAVVVYKDGFYQLKIRDNHSYDIPSSRISGPDELVGWIAHLIPKGWVTKEHIRKLITLCHKNGVSVNYHA